MEKEKESLYKTLYQMVSLKHHNAFMGKRKMKIMQNFELSQILAQIVDETDKGYITLSDLKMQLKKDNILFGLESTSTVEEVRNQIKPFLGDTLRIYPEKNIKNKPSYLALKNKEIEIVITYIKKYPNKSHLQIKNALPIVPKTTIQILNRLIADRKITVSFNESTSPFTPKLSMSESATGTVNDSKKDSKSNQTNIPKKSTLSETTNPPSQQKSSVQFKDAYFKLVKGRRFVKIYEIRRALNWDRDSFDRLIEKLRDDGQIFLQQADISKMGENDIKDSFIDENNILMILVTWEG